jgi:2-oxoisovalerate dehydrogenase E1 component
MDGANHLVFGDTFLQAAGRARVGGGPALIECRVPRLWGHYNKDIEHYRPKEDRDEAQARDPIEKFSNMLLSDSILSPQEIDDIAANVKAEVQELAQKVLDSPPPDPATAADHVYAPILQPARSRSSDPGGETKNMSFIQAVNEALNRELESRPEVLVYGEDLGNSGGVFGATRGLQKKYGAARVFDTPISESAILGSAVGAALCGMKPIVEIMWADFMLVALDQIINQAANVRYITQGRSGAPIVVRTQQGVTPGSCAQHSQSLEALLAHIPGIRVAVSATPQDAYDLLRSAAAASDPCVLFEARSLYQTSGPVHTGKEVEPIGKARIHRPGKDAVIVTWGTMLNPALQAAETLKGEKRDVGVLDLRWLNPLDEATLISVVNTAGGRGVVAHEANRTGGFAAEVLARLQELTGHKMPLKTARVATPNVRIPASPVLMRELVPGPEQIAQAVRSLWA